jgi:hypothetical protein
VKKKSGTALMMENATESIEIKNKVKAEAVQRLVEQNIVPRHRLTPPFARSVSWLRHWL